PRPVRSNKGSYLALFYIHTDIIDYYLIAIFFSYIPYLYHIAFSFSSKYIKYTPPMKFIITLMGVLKFIILSAINCPPTRATELISIEPTMVYLCLYVFKNSRAMFTTNNPKKIIGPTKAVDTDTNIQITMSI